MKKGIILLSVLMLISVLSLIILQSTSISEKFLKRNSKALFLTQLNKTFLDINGFLKLISPMIKNPDIFDMMLKAPLIIHEKQSDININMFFEPITNTLNINHIYKNDKINQEMYDFLYLVLQKYDIRDSYFFINILLDTLDKDDEERVYESEIIKKNNFFQNGENMDKKTFDYILNYYAVKRNDSRIFQINFEKYFNFSTPKSDFNYLNSEIKEILWQNYSIYFPTDNKIIKSFDELSMNDDDKQKLKNLDIDFNIYLLKSNLTFFYLNQSAKISQIYDIKNKKVTDIELFF